MIKLEESKFNVGWEREMFSVQYKVHTKSEGDEVVAHIMDNEKKLEKIKKILQDHNDFKVNDFDTLRRVHELIKVKKNVR